MFPFMPVAVVSKVIVASFDLYMTYRQRSKFHDSEKPSTRIESLIPPSKFKKAQAYCRAKSSFQLITGTIDTILEALTAVYFLSPYVWTQSSKFAFIKTELHQTLMYLGIFSMISLLTELPSELYNTFVLEAKFGFNKTSMKTFVFDKIKGLVLSCALGVPMLSCLYYLLKFVEQFDAWAVGVLLWGLSVFFMVLMMWLFPSVIAPMFNTFTPMNSDSKVKEKVEELAKKLTFPLSEMYVIDGSKRSAHSNAFIFGLFKKYICIFDTLLEQCGCHSAIPSPPTKASVTSIMNPKPSTPSTVTENDDEVVAVVCHELGHWQYGHLRSGLIKAMIHTFIICILYGVTSGNEALFQSFGFTDGLKPVIIGILLFNNMLSPLDDLMHPFHNYISRKHEYEADQFAKGKNMAVPLGNALVRMSIENLSNMNPDSLYSMWNYSHPTLIERLDALCVNPKLSDVVKDEEPDEQDSEESSSVSSKKDQ